MNLKSMFQIPYCVLKKFWKRLHIFSICCFLILQLYFQVLWHFSHFFFEKKEIKVKNEKQFILIQSSQQSGLGFSQSSTNWFTIVVLWIISSIFIFPTLNMQILEVILNKNLVYQRKLQNCHASCFHTITTLLDLCSLWFDRANSHL